MALSTETDLRKARKLKGNRRPQVCFQGQTPQHGKFVLTRKEAETMAAKDPKSKSVLFPYMIGRDLTKTAAPSRFMRRRLRRRALANGSCTAWTRFRGGGSRPGSSSAG